MGPDGREYAEERRWDVRRSGNVRKGLQVAVGMGCHVRFQFDGLQNTRWIAWCAGFFLCRVNVCFYAL